MATLYRLPFLCLELLRHYSFHMLEWLGQPLMDDVHLLTARHFRYELRLLRGGKIFSSKFGAREVCIAPQMFNCY